MIRVPIKQTFKHELTSPIKVPEPYSAEVRKLVQMLGVLTTAIDNIEHELSHIGDSDFDAEAVLVSIVGVLNETNKQKSQFT